MANPYAMSVEMAAALLLSLSCPKFARMHQNDLLAISESVSKAAGSDCSQFGPVVGSGLESQLSPQKVPTTRSTRQERRVTENDLRVQARTRRAGPIDNHAAEETEVGKESDAVAVELMVLGGAHGGEVVQDMRDHVRKDVREGSVTDDEGLGEFEYTAGRRILKCTGSKTSWTISPYATATQAVRARQILARKLSQRTPSKKQGTGSMKVLMKGLRSHRIGKCRLPPLKELSGNTRVFAPSENGAIASHHKE